MSHEPIPVEPLAPATWTRIEAGVFRALAEEARATQRSRRTTRWWYVAMPAAVAIAAGVALLVSAPRSVDDAVVASAPSDAARVVAAAPGPSKPHVLIAKDAPLRYEVAGSTLSLDADAEVAFDEPTGEGVRVELRRGRVGFKVKHQLPGEHFVVEAGKTRVRVVGTEFTVAREGQGGRVDVSQGAVEVQEGEVKLVLHAGQSWPEVPEARNPVDDQRRRLTASSESPRELYVKAANLEKTNASRAAKLYRRAASGTGSWASNALYALAMLELDRGRSRLGKQCLREYLERFPEGENAADAARLLKHN